MTHVAFESKLRQVTRAPMHPCPRIESAVVLGARAAHAFSAGIICRHCRLSNPSLDRDGFLVPLPHFVTLSGIQPDIFITRMYNRRIKEGIG